MRNYTLTIKRVANGHIVEHPDAFGHATVVRVFESNEDMLSFLNNNYFVLGDTLRPTSVPGAPDQPTEEPQKVELEIESPDDPVYGTGANEPAYSEQFDKPATQGVIDATDDTDVLINVGTSMGVGLNDDPAEPDYGPVAEIAHTIHPDGSVTSSSES